MNALSFLFVYLIVVSCSTSLAFTKLSKRASKAIGESTPDIDINLWVFFKDKGLWQHNNIFDTILDSIHSQLHPKTLWRRSARGTGGVAVSVHDIPVFDGYIIDLLDTGVKLRRTSKWLNAVSVSLPVADIGNKLQQLEALPYVQSIDVVATFVRAQDHAHTTMEAREYHTTQEYEDDIIDLYGSSYTQLSQINVTAAHALGYNGTGVIIMVADTGFLKTHPAFSMTRILDEYDFVKNDSDSSPDSRYETHGTATFSNIGGWAPGQLIGSAFGASFLLAKTEDSSSETSVEEDNFIQALEWGEERGMEVVSASLGYSHWYTFADFDGETAPITIASDRAMQNGVVVVLANGNSDQTGISAPADGNYVISVGAVDSNGKLARFSSWGPTADGRIKPEVCAHGKGNKVADSTTNGYKTMDGTSFSCPLIAGVAAILLQAHPDWTPAMVKEALTSTASQSENPDIFYGWGIADTIGALHFHPQLGNCTTLNCSNSGYCDSGWCRCPLTFYGNDCSLSRVACDTLCQKRGGACEAQPNFFQCGPAAPVVCNDPTCLPREEPTKLYLVGIGAVCFFVGVILALVIVLFIKIVKR